jgi:hypothetical protein
MMLRVMPQGGSFWVNWESLLFCAHATPLIKRMAVIWIMVLVFIVVLIVRATPPNGGFSGAV